MATLCCIIAWLPAHAPHEVAPAPEPGARRPGTVTATVERDVRRGLDASPEAGRRTSATAGVRLTGRCVDADSGEAVRGAGVRLRRRAVDWLSGSETGAAATTDEHGVFSVAWQPHEASELILQHRDFSTATVAVRDRWVPAGTREIGLGDIPLRRRQGLEVRVVDAQRVPVAGARVVADRTGPIRTMTPRRSGSANTYSLLFPDPDGPVTDEQGRCRLAMDRRVGFLLGVLHPRFLTARVRVEAGQADVDVVLESGTTASVLIRNDSGEAVDECEVVLTDPESRLLATHRVPMPMQTPRLFDVRSGTLIRCTGYRSGRAVAQSRRSARVGPGAPGSVVLDLVPIAGRELGVRWMPQEGRDQHVFLVTGIRIGDRWVATGRHSALAAAGEARLAAPTGVEVMVTAYIPSLGFASPRYVGRTDTEVRLEFEPTLPRALEVRVVDAGRPLPRAWVELGFEPPASSWPARYEAPGGTGFGLTADRESGDIRLRGRCDEAGVCRFDHVPSTGLYLRAFHGSRRAGPIELDRNTRDCVIDLGQEGQVTATLVGAGLAGCLPHEVEVRAIGSDGARIDAACPDSDWTVRLATGTLAQTVTVQVWRKPPLPADIVCWQVVPELMVSTRQLESRPRARAELSIADGPGADVLVVKRGGSVGPRLRISTYRRLSRFDRSRSWAEAPDAELQLLPTFDARGEIRVVGLPDAPLLIESVALDGTSTGQVFAESGREQRRLTIRPCRRTRLLDLPAPAGGTSKWTARRLHPAQKIRGPALALTRNPDATGDLVCTPGTYEVSVDDRVAGTVEVQGDHRAARLRGR